MTLYEKPEIEHYGGGSGIWSREYETPLGELRAIHWSLSSGKCTEIYIVHGRARWPEIRLDGHLHAADPSFDWVALYLRKLVELGGAEVLQKTIATAMKESFDDGAESARAVMREALGFQ